MHSFPHIPDAKKQSSWFRLLEPLVQARLKRDNLKNRSGSMFAISADENINLKSNKMEHAFMIQQAIQKENKDFFFPRSMQVELLKNCPQVIPILAQWLYEEWHPYDVSLTKEKMIHSFQLRLNADTTPITFVVLKDDLPIGTISLKKESAPEFADFPDNAIWMSSLQVVPEERNQGVGQELLKLSQAVAKQFSCEKLYFYTSNPANVKWYLKRGAQVIEERPFRHHKITIMEISLKN